MDNFLPANWTLSIWMESGWHLIKVTDNSTSKTAVLSIPKCFHHLLRMPVSGPWGTDVSHCYRQRPTRWESGYQWHPGTKPICPWCHTSTPRKKKLYMKQTFVVVGLKGKTWYLSWATQLANSPWSEWTKENLHCNSQSIPHLHRLLGWHLQWLQLEAQPLC